MKPGYNVGCGRPFNLISYLRNFSQVYVKLDHKYPKEDMLRTVSMMGYIIGLKSLHIETAHKHNAYFSELNFFILDVPVKV